MGDLLGSLWEIGDGLVALHARTKVTGLKGSEAWYSARSRHRRKVFKIAALTLSVILTGIGLFY